jgi:heterodisulfide reductase subunit A
MGQHSRFGIYLCNCGRYYIDRVDFDRVREGISGMERVQIARKEDSFCAEEDGRIRIEKDVKEKNLNAVIIAACTGNEEKFRKAIESAGPDSYRMHVIRMVALCRRYPEKERATEETLSLIRSLVAEGKPEGEWAEWVSSHAGQL